MSYKFLSSHLPKDLVNEILSFMYSNEPERTPLRETQMISLQFYVEWSAPLLRKKYSNWSVFTRANPFLVVYYLTFINKREFEARFLNN